MGKISPPQYSINKKTMIKKRFMNILLMAALTVVLSLGVTSCSDDDKDKSNTDTDSEMTEEERAQDPFGKQTEKAQTLLRIISQLTDVTELPDQWQTATFEPTNGFVADAGNPYSRTQSVSGAADAARRYNSLTGADIDSTTTSHTWQYDGLGKMTYRLTGDAEQLATIDIDLEQMPHLKRIVYARDLGMNGSWSGTPYYRLGDVVCDKEGSYWVCVRSAWAYSKKEESHWISTSKLPEKNMVYYNKGKDDELCLPTALGNSTLHMRNFVDLFFALLWPEEYADMQQMLQLQVKKGLGDIEYVYHSKYYLKNVRFFYTKLNIWPYIFKFDKEMVEFEQLDQLKSRYTPLNLYYNGYVMAGLSSQTGCYMRSYSGNGWQKESTDKEDKRRFAKAGGRKFSIQELAEKGYGYSPALNSTTSAYAYVVRYKTGEQLAKDNGKGKYDKQQAIPGVTEIYRYNAQPELNLPSDYLAQDVKPVTSSVADNNDYIYGNFFDLKNMIIEGNCVVNNNQNIGFAVINNGMMVTYANLHVDAIHEDGSKQAIESRKAIDISRNNAKAFTYNWMPSKPGVYKIRAYVEESSDTLFSSICITDIDRSSEMIKIESNLPEYIDADDMANAGPYQLSATNNNPYRTGSLIYTVLVYEGSNLISHTDWSMFFSGKGESETFNIDLKPQIGQSRTVKVINGLYGVADVDTVYSYTVGIEVPHTAVITCDNPAPMVGETQNFTIKVTSHGGTGGGGKFTLLFYHSKEQDESVDFDSFSGQEGETKTYTWTHKAKSEGSYTVAFFDGFGNRIGELTDEYWDHLFEGDLDEVLFGYVVQKLDTFQVNYTVKNVAGRSGRIKLEQIDGNEFSELSDVIDIPKGATYHGKFELVAPSLGEKLQWYGYRIQLKDATSNKMIGKDRLIRVTHKGVYNLGWN